MKLSNFFKKNSSKNSDSKTTNIQRLDKKQLKKVIGGTDIAETKAQSFATGLVVKGSSN